MFTIIRGGCFSRHSPDFFMQRPDGLPYYVLLIIKTNSELTIKEHHQICRPDSALIIRPNTPYSYKNPNGEYIDDWIHFSCSPEDLAMLDDSMFHKSFPISNTRLLTTYIQQLLWEQNFGIKDSKDYYVDTLFHILLRHLYDDYHAQYTDEYNPYRFKLQNLRLEIQAAPYKKYSAQEIADRFDISASYFQHLYKLFFHVPFHTDIINMRIDYAKEMITCTSLSLEQIAYSCGYLSEVHFYRQFLTKMGMTPGEYRKIYSIKS